MALEIQYDIVFRSILANNSVCLPIITGAVRVSMSSSFMGMQLSHGAGCLLGAGQASMSSSLGFELVK